jgi:hypothetical protein
LPTSTKGSTHGVNLQARQGLRPEPRGEQVKEQVKEQARKPENRRKLADFGKRYIKRR